MKLLSQRFLDLTIHIESGCFGFSLWSDEFEEFFDFNGLHKHPFHDLAPEISELNRDRKIRLDAWYQVAKP